jgi:hypothetical protein
VRQIWTGASPQVHSGIGNLELGSEGNSIGRPVLSQALTLTEGFIAGEVRSLPCVPESEVPRNPASIPQLLRTERERPVLGTSMPRLIPREWGEGSAFRTRPNKLAFDLGL